MKYYGLIGQVQLVNRVTIFTIKALTAQEMSRNKAEKRSLQTRTQNLSKSVIFSIFILVVYQPVFYLLRIIRFSLKRCITLAVT